MGVSFIPCVGCARHVRQDDRASIVGAVCPFCGAGVVRAPLAIPAARQRLSRAALFAAGAAGVALATVDCVGTAEPSYGGVSPTPTSTSESTSTSGSTSQATSASTGSTGSSSEEIGSVVALYGGVGVIHRDAGDVDATGEND
jgi:hypothetical protein